VRQVKVGTPEYEAALKTLAARGDAEDLGVARVVAEIVADVRARGDAAVIDCTARFDGVRLRPDAMAFSDGDVKEAYDRADAGVVEALRYSAGRIRAFHERQVREGYRYESEEGVHLGQIVRPLAAAGIYVPGGKAAYPSTVLMNAIPAKVAGVPEIVMVTPTPGGEVNPYLLVAADIIQTVIIDTTISTMAQLGLLILVRTVLGWTLSVEVEGHWPWQEHKQRTARPGAE